MRPYFVTVALVLLGISQQDTEEEVRDMLDFVELNLANLLQYGTYPALYDASYTRIRECGCFYSPRKINWGSHIGLECRREAEPGDEMPAFDPELCGIQCNDQHGFDTILLCPPGWEKGCQSGCVPKEIFESIEARVSFWESTLNGFLLQGTDHITIARDYLDACGCVSKARRILYGTKVGFDCVRGEDAEVKPGCNAEANCKDERGRQLVQFCPSGHTSTCSGCVKEISGDDVVTRLRWMVGVTSDLVQLSLPELQWQPALEQILGCGCKGSVEQITYGAGIGVICEIHSAQLIGPQCGENQICVDNDGREILHICPKGFKPSCEHGCASPTMLMDDKLEL